MTPLRKIIVVLAAVAAVLGFAAVPAAAAGPVARPCFNATDTITKTDSGHGTPPEWANLAFTRKTRVCGDSTNGYDVTLTDDGTLTTIAGAGAPNGHGTISREVTGHMSGGLTVHVTGAALALDKRNAKADGSTAFVKSMFEQGAVLGEVSYSWTYTTRCEKWVDSSANNDGTDTNAGNITSRALCGGWHKSPHSHQGAPSGEPSAKPSTAPGTPAAGGEAPPAQPVTGTPHFTG